MQIATNIKQQPSSFINFIPKLRKPLRTFHHLLDNNNPEFFIDSIEDQPGFYQMTAQGPRLRPGESIKIDQSGQFLTYQVDDIEYYSETSDMWMAVLRKV